MYVKVKFQPDGKDYVYRSPFIVVKGQLVLINAYGKYQVATVVAVRNKRPPGYDGQINDIAGLCYTNEDLTQPQPQEQSSFLERVVKSVIGGS